MQRMLETDAHKKLPSSRRRVLYRITIPFTLLFVATSVLSWIFSACFISTYTDRNLKRQMEQVAGLISHAGYILNPEMLEKLKQVIDCDIAVYDAKGGIISSTFDDAANQPVLNSALLGELRKNTSSVLKDISHAGVRYYTALHIVSLPQQGSALLSIWMPSNKKDHLRATIIAGLGAIALFGMFIMAGAGYLIARTITAPIEELVKVTEKIADGNLHQKVYALDNSEIGVLADSVNRMMAKLLQYERRIVESEKMAAAGQMAAGFAHEIRNPLTSVKMLAQVLRRRLKGQVESQRMIDSLVHEIDRLDRIIKDMIDRTRPGELRLAHCDLNSIIREVGELALGQLTPQNVSLEYRLCAQLPTVQLDREKIKQVLWNLILNAQEAMPKGGELVLSTQAGQNGTIELTVEDSGMGVGSEGSERVFEPFFTTKPEGMGLGLTISREIIAKHGGALRLESRAEGGARATVTLPMNRVFTNRLKECNV